MVSPQSDYTKPEDLVGVGVQVGYQSGSHYATIQALEEFLPLKKSNCALPAIRHSVLIIFLMA